MKLFLLVLIVPCFAFSQTKKVKLKLVQVMPYCGGAKPTEEMKKASELPVAYANKKLIYISDKQKVDTLLTDAKGVLSTKLSYGVYAIFEPWKYYKALPKGMQESNLQMDCLKEEWLKEDLKITVTKKAAQVVNHLKYPKCAQLFPCLINKHLTR
jgi:hypothetical protein